MVCAVTVTVAVTYPPPTRAAVAHTPTVALPTVQTLPPRWRRTPQTGVNAVDTAEPDITHLAHPPDPDGCLRWMPAQTSPLPRTDLLTVTPLDPDYTRITTPHLSQL